MCRFDLVNGGSRAQFSVTYLVSIKAELGSARNLENVHQHSCHGDRHQHSCHGDRHWAATGASRSRGRED
jgi:hypothetical protein